jgi:hypothetical protein
VAIPPLLPWQVQTADGTVHGGESSLTVTVALTGGRGVTATSSEAGSHFVDFGVPGGQFNTADNSETFDYAEDGTYTVTMSSGGKTGSAEVTVPGAVEDGGEQQSTAQRLVGAVTHKKKKAKG